MINQQANKISMQRITGSLAELIDEFDDQWTKYVVHHYYTRTQIDYIKRIKEETHDQGSMVIHMDSAENHSPVVQHEA